MLTGFLEVDIVEDLKVQGLRVENCLQKTVSEEAIPRLLVGSLSFMLPY